MAPTAASLVGTSAKPTDDADDATAVAGGWSGTAGTDRASATGTWRGSLRSKDRFQQQRQLGASCNWSESGSVGTARHRRSLHVRSVKSEYSTDVRRCQLCPQSAIHREHAAFPRKETQCLTDKGETTQRDTRACRGYLAGSGTDVCAVHREIDAAERGNDGGGDVHRSPTGRESGEEVPRKGSERATAGLRDGRASRRSPSSFR